MASVFSKNLRLLRQENQLTQTTASAALGISQALLSHYENDMREPGLAFINRVCDYYHVSADYLLGRTGVREPVSEEAAPAAENAEGSVKSSARSSAVCDSTAILFDLLEQLPNDKAADAAQQYMGTAIYRLYRALSNSAPDSSKVLLATENLDFVHSACNADLILDEIEYTKALSELKDVKGAFPTCNYGALKEKYPALYQSLFRLVYESNQRVDQMISAHADPEGGTRSEIPEDL